MLKVAIVGCGKIADAHASQIQRIKGCEMVGVCDLEPLMARQLQERFPIKRCFGDVNELLIEAKPDVVHVTTPPAHHFDIARLCMLHGCHVYVEKPITLNAGDAERLVELAQEKGLKLTVGHDDQFSHVARRMRRLVQSGYLGGLPVHMESTFCVEFTTVYARAVWADKEHWVRKLPGKLLHNIINHGIARIAEFLSSDSPQVTARGFSSPLLQNVGESEIMDELRVIINDGERTTAYLTFSSQMRPLLHEFRIYGPKNGILLDQDHEILLKLSGKRFTSYVDKFVPPVLFAQQQLANLAFNLKTFARRDFHPKAGMKCLIESFYRSIIDDAPVPIPYSEILRTSVIMDQIFNQIREKRTVEPLARNHDPSLLTDRRQPDLTTA